MRKKQDAKVHLCSELVHVYLGHATMGERRKVVANLEEISESVAELMTEEPIPAGCRVEIHCQYHILKGFVESDTNHEILGHILRVKLDVESQWSEKLFTPQHLLSLWKEVEEPRVEPRQGPQRGRAA